MKEEKRRKIAREFLENEFGKRMVVPQINFVGEPFQLWRDWDSMKPGTNEARAFEVIYAPYISGAKKRMITVSDSEEERREIVKKCFDQERIKVGCVEYETYKGYKIAYD